MKQAQSLILRRKQILAVVTLALTLALTFVHVSAAVTVSSFSAQALTSTILVKWATASELGNSGFYIYRSTSQGGPFTKISNLIPVAFPNSLLGSSYSYTDTTTAKGHVYYYKLQAIDSGGGTRDFGPVNAAISAPTSTPTAAAPVATSTTASTASRTPTTAATATATGVSASSNPTATDSPTVYSSPTPLGTPPPTSMRIPTRVALFVDPAAPSPTVAAPPRARSNNNALPPAPPKSNEPVSLPTIAVVVESPSQQDSPATVDNSTDEALPNSTPAPSAERNPLLVAVTLIGGVAAMTVIAVGAVSFYLIARRFIR